MDSVKFDLLFRLNFISMRRYYSVVKKTFSLKIFLCFLFFSIDLFAFSPPHFAFMNESLCKGELKNRRGKTTNFALKLFTVNLVSLPHWGTGKDFLLFAHLDDFIEHEYGKRFADKYYQLGEAYHYCYAPAVFSVRDLKKVCYKNRHVIFNQEYELTMNEYWSFFGRDYDYDPLIEQPFFRYIDKPLIFGTEGEFLRIIQESEFYSRGKYPDGIYGAYDELKEKLVVNKFNIKKFISYSEQVRGNSSRKKNRFAYVRLNGKDDYETPPLLYYQILDKYKSNKASYLDFNKYNDIFGRDKKIKRGTVLKLCFDPSKCKDYKVDLKFTKGSEPGEQLLSLTYKRLFSRSRKLGELKCSFTTPDGDVGTIFETPFYYVNPGLAI